MAATSLNDTSSLNRDIDDDDGDGVGCVDGHSCDNSSRDVTCDANDEQLDEERELPKTFTKARPFSEQRENKFTSTLRRLSTVRYSVTK